VGWTLPGVWATLAARATTAAARRRRISRTRRKVEAYSSYTPVFVL